ncbi:MAG: gamma-glutamyltransferase [Planctomycetota bacterium]|nr:gamma-glutamyltransferase [Planctomycetota bacterium]
MTSRTLRASLGLVALPIASWAIESVALAQEPSVAKPIPIGRHDRPSGPIYQSRSVVVAQHGMACTSDPRATAAAIGILENGGSAIDAAIAANAVLGVVEPMSCGIGGDLYSIVWDSQTGKISGLNASGRSPAKLTREVFAEQGLKEIPLYGPMSWSVPGCVAGWYDLHTKFGKKSMAEVLEPAIELAERGFAVSPVIAGYWAKTEQSFLPWPDSKATFLIDGKKAPKTGDVFRNRRLADSYRRIAQFGPDHFYRGPIAEQIVAFSEKNGGYFGLDDFANHVNEWVEPVSTNYRGYDVWQIPPNGQGLAVLQMLNVLERHDLPSMGWGSADYTHLLIEAKKLAYADRARFYADTAFESVPIERLNSKSYAEIQNRRIDPQRALVDVPHGDPKLVHGDTVYLCVVDADRNCCSLIQSNFHGFGSQVVPGEVGFALQNRGNLFALSEDHPNRLEPKKRPFHTIIPALVTRDKKPVFVFGVMGGDMQPQGQVQVLVNWIDFGMNIQMAGDAARVRHEGSASPTGTPADAAGGVVYHESGLPQATLEALARRGHALKASRASFGGYQGILIDWERGILQGATESRNDGLALGTDRPIE